MKRLLFLPLALLLSHCSMAPPSPSGPHAGPYAGGAPPPMSPGPASGAPVNFTVRHSGGGMPQIVNVSAYDPKEKQRNGRSYSEHDVSPLCASGACALIARAGKGGNLDEKCAHFIASADRCGMLPGLYYRVQKHVDPVRQADQFVDRAFALSRGRAWNAPALLLCGDYDGDLPLSSILRFMDRVESRTGVVPVAYMENSQQAKLQMRGADPATKARLRRAPYWAALYSHESGAGPVFPAPGSPEGLVGQYGLWNNWTMWQYGGVDWEGGRSRPKVYSAGRYRFSPYFGTLDRPVERNVFRGSPSSLLAFWQQHGLRLHQPPAGGALAFRTATN